MSTRNSHRNSGTGKNVRKTEGGSQVPIIKAGVMK